MTSFDPLKVYLFKDGLCRFATETYDKKKIKSKFSHLTNFSINKNNPKVILILYSNLKFVKNQKASEDDFGSKWSI